MAVSSFLCLYPIQIQPVPLRRRTFQPFPSHEECKMLLWSNPHFDAERITVSVPIGNSESTLRAWLDTGIKGRQI